MNIMNGASNMQMSDDVLVRGLGGDPLLRVHWLRPAPQMAPPSTQEPLRCLQPSFDPLSLPALQPRFVVPPAALPRPSQPSTSSTQGYARDGVLCPSRVAAELRAMIKPRTCDSSDTSAQRRTCDSSDTSAQRIGPGALDVDICQQLHHLDAPGWASVLAQLKLGDVPSPQGWGAHMAGIAKLIECCSPHSAALSDYVVFELLPQFLRAAHADRQALHAKRRKNNHGRVSPAQAQCDWDSLAAVATVALRGSSLLSRTPAHFRVELQAMGLRAHEHGECGAEMELLLAHEYYDARRVG